jgi:copper chaperone NosL
LQNINELNHYIGMKVIDPAAIPVLRVMPWVVAGLVLFGLAAAASGRRGVLYSWMAAFVGFGALGMGEFWWWEYDYGHHLDFAHAIIKIPGMTYQPPLIGARQLLNFRAISMPDWGAWCVGLAFALGVAAIVTARRASAGAPGHAGD